MKRRKLLVEELNRVSIDEFHDVSKIPLTIILDNVRSQHNIGSVFRTSDAFLVEEIILCGITATPPNAEIHKTALGSEDSVKWSYHEDTVSVVSHLKDVGYTVYAIEQTENSLMLDDMELNRNKKYALVLGHEVHGVQQSVIDACHNCIEIPQFGTKHSLNVSVAGGIVIWDFFKMLSK